MRPAISVITISDRAFAGVYPDRSGPAVVETLRTVFPDADIRTRLVSDDPDALRAALQDALDCHLVVTTGGTGLGPRDSAPEVTSAFCDRTVPGIAEFLRAESRKETQNAVFPRGFAGMKGKTLYVNLPGSERAARFCAGALAPLLPHALAMIRGEGHA